MRISLRAQRTMLRGLRKLYGGEVTLVVLAEREERFAQADTQALGTWESPKEKQVKVV